MRDGANHQALILKLTARRQTRHAARQRRYDWNNCLPSHGSFPQRLNARALRRAHLPRNSLAHSLAAPGPFFFFSGDTSSVACRCSAARHRQFTPPRSSRGPNHKRETDACMRRDAGQWIGTIRQARNVKPARHQSGRRARPGVAPAAARRRSGACSRAKWTTASPPTACG